MNSAQGHNAYRQLESQVKIHPVKLIHMIYERVLQHLETASQAIASGNFQERGEHLGKCIALITELQAAIKEDDKSDAAEFLRGLYSAILVELPKVSVSNDAAILQQASTYIERLKEIWEQTAMQEVAADIQSQQHHEDLADQEELVRATKMPSTGGLSVAI